MAPSQLTRLKASIHERRSKGGSKQQEKPKQVQKNYQKNKVKFGISIGEENRKRTLLPELQRRLKVGGIIDRRIGENDPTLAPEDRALQRFTQESRRSKRDSLFNLEDADDEEEPLTHLGHSISTETNGKGKDDFRENGLLEESDDPNDIRDESDRPKRRRRVSEDIERLQDARQDGQAERRKTKKEVMEEVIAKSKLHKYERQKAKDDDDDMREELDRALPDLLAALRGDRSVKAAPSIVPATQQHSAIHPDRAALLDAGTIPQTDKEYDQRIRQMAMDKRAQPTERTKTEEEKAQAEADRLREFEEHRLRRMRAEESEDDAEYAERTGDGDLEEYVAENGEAADFGLSLKPAAVNVEDEDNFIIDEDLVASGSEIDTDFEDEESEPGINPPEDDDADFLQDLIPRTEGKSDIPQLAYTYPCPQTHTDLLKVLQDVPASEVVTVIQRIRALYHSQLKVENKEKLSNFSVALVKHLAHIGTSNPPLVMVESLVRHVHSLSRAHTDAVSRAFRSQLQRMHERATLTPGDLIILTAISSIYPTSDHFHQVVTPAITIMARWLGMTTSVKSSESLIGAYVVALCIKYQSLSKRYIPETIRFTFAALNSNPPSETLNAHVSNLTSLMDLWADKSAFTEIFTPDILLVLKTHNHPSATRKLTILLSQARLRRRPLQLHHHRPLPIKTSIPKFEDNFNPEKHYDPDRERAEAGKLRKEYKREHKGALRELKKDASFIAREQLRQKREGDRAYEVKQRRLVAEIQAEEGREGNVYEREKRARKGRK